MATIELQPVGKETTIPVSIEEKEESVFTVHIEDNRYTFKFQTISPSSGWVCNTENGEIIPYYFYMQGDEVNLWVLGRIYRFNLSSRRQYKRKKGEPVAASGEIKAPMPGTVLKVMVAKGDRVEAGTPLLLMESMKMEMTMAAPANGWIADIYCSTGQMVEMNMVLIKLETLKDEPVLS